MNLTEKSAYIKGLADGLELDKTTKEGKILAALLELVDEMAQAVADIQVDIEEIDEDLDYLNDYVEELDDDLEVVEDFLDDEVESDDEDEDEDWDDDFECEIHNSQFPFDVFILCKNGKTLTRQSSPILISIMLWKDIRRFWCRS